MTGAEPSTLRLSGLGIDFPDGPAVSDLDLVVEAGEVVVLLGPSGCGKSTVLRAVAGLQRATRGTIEIDGQGVSGTSSDRALVFQDDALLPWRSAAANVELALKLAARGPRAPRRAEAVSLLGSVGLEGFEDHLPGHLSGGMRQRVQLARTLALHPRVMLMDEPFGALDAQTRSAMQALLIDVCRRHRTTVVFVTHDVDEALLLGDRVAILSPRPARVEAVVRVANPRDLTVRGSADFAAARERLLRHLSTVAA